MTIYCHKIEREIKNNNNKKIVNIDGVSVQLRNIKPFQRDY